MAIDVKLPELGEGIESGDVLELLVKEGDTVKADQGLLELETDKATVTVPSPAAGIVLKILVAPGDSVPVGQLVVQLEAGSGAAAETAPAPPVAAPPTPVEAAQPAAPPPAPAPATPPPAPAPPPPALRRPERDPRHTGIATYVIRQGGPDRGEWFADVPPMTASDRDGTEPTGPRHCPQSRYTP